MGGRHSQEGPQLATGPGGVREWSWWRSPPGDGVCQAAVRLGASPGGKRERWRVVLGAVHYSRRDKEDRAGVLGAVGRSKEGRGVLDAQRLSRKDMVGVLAARRRSKSGRGVLSVKRFSRKDRTRNLGAKRHCKWGRGKGGEDGWEQCASSRLVSPWGSVGADSPTVLVEHVLMSVRVVKAL